METKKVLAVDLGASSGRVMLGSFDGEKITAVSYTHLDVYKRQPWNSSKRKQATNSGLNSSLIRAITITSTVFLPKNTRISRPSREERSPRLPGKWWISAMNAAGRR